MNKKHHGCYQPYHGCYEPSNLVALISSFYKSTHAVCLEIHTNPPSSTLTSITISIFHLYLIWHLHLVIIITTM